MGWSMFGRFTAGEAAQRSNDCASAASAGTAEHSPGGAAATACTAHFQGQNRQSDESCNSGCEIIAHCTVTVLCQRARTLPG